MVRLHVVRRLPSYTRVLGRGELRLERRGDLQRDLGLNGEDVRHPSVVRLRPEMAGGLGVHQLRDDAHTIARATDAAGQHDGRAEGGTDLPERGPLLPEV